MPLAGAIVSGLSYAASLLLLLLTLSTLSITNHHRVSISIALQYSGVHNHQLPFYNHPALRFPSVTTWRSHLIKHHVSFLTSHSYLSLVRLGVGPCQLVDPSGVIELIELILLG